MVATLTASGGGVSAATTYPNARTLFPTAGAGFALSGDGREYRNFDGENNFVITQPAYELRTEWQAGRRLFLNITSNVSGVAYPPISYTCVTGPEDPLHPENPNYPALGADFYLSNARLLANIQCYNETHDAGYYVSFINPQTCFVVTETPSLDPRFIGGKHYMIDGAGCTATVSQRSGTKVTTITSGGRKGTPIVFNVPVHVEFDSALQ
ncbi:MAG: hypothetical protein M3273_06190 [Actinomycetota bacterium]|nr:hypothetical protein [Actinomycetota bacterium]